MTEPVPVEVSIKIKGESGTYNHKVLTYETVLMQPGAPTLAELVKEASEHYKGDVESISIKCAMEWQ